MRKTTFKIKRIYETRSKADGYRVLVDRLWPRGIKKEDAAVDLWAKELAPSPPLRKWFNHQPDKFLEFSERYTNELGERQEAAESLRSTGHTRITLLYAARDEVHNHATVLLDFLSRVEG